MYLFGCALTQTLVDTAKFNIGRLRPHFFHVCEPDWDGFECYNDRGLPIYVTDYECKGNPDLFPDEGERQTRVEDAHLSFMSGHASFSFQVQWTPVNTATINT